MTSRTPTPQPVPTTMTTTPFPILLTIRFSASIPDIPLEIARPESTTGAGLKQLIRSHLSPTYARRRLRLIYAGRALEDTTALWTSLRLGSMAGAQLEEGELERELDPKGKGKRAAHKVPRMKLWVHCSMGDIVLSREELEKEEKNASVEEVVKQRGGPMPGETTEGGKKTQQKQQQSGDGLDAQADTTTTTATTTIPAPRGFDRLLNAGFTPSEISAMRSQFLAMQSLSRTPDTMPSGDELRELEDRWIDEGISDAAGGAAAVGGGTGNGGGQGLSTADENYSGSLDDMMMGVTMGFFWPVGCGVWLLREEGVWSWRKGLAVAIGMIMNLSFGWIRFFG